MEILASGMTSTAQDSPAIHPGRVMEAEGWRRWQGGRAGGLARIEGPGILIEEECAESVVNIGTGLRE